MKNAIAITALLMVCLVARPQENHSKTYSVLPGKTLNIENRAYHVVEIRTEYPVQVAAGPCHADSTVQIRCTFDDPSDLFIRDLRVPPVFSQPRANSITITVGD